MRVLPVRTNSPLARENRTLPQVEPSNTDSVFPQSRCTDPVPQAAARDGADDPFVVVRASDLNRLHRAMPTVTVVRRAWKWDRFIFAADRDE
jgi:hypothetical protein